MYSPHSRESYQPVSKHSQRQVGFPKLTYCNADQTPSLSPACQQTVSFPSHLTYLITLQNSQLAIRPDADQHLRMTTHGCLENRQRAIAHLPVFLHNSNISTHSLLASSIDQGAQHTICAISYSLHTGQHFTPHMGIGGEKLTCTHCEASGGGFCRRVSAYSLRKLVVK